MAPLTIERLRLLLAVSAHGTIAGAAEDVGYTPSAVSQQLSALERELGTTLLERSNRGVSLTPAGARLSERASVILDLTQMATIEATQAGPRAAPIALRIGAFPTAISSIVVPAIALLAPMVAVTIVDVEPEQAFADLAARHLDAAIVDYYESALTPSRAGLHHVTLVTDPLRIAIRSDRLPPQAPRDLVDMPWILGGTHSRLGHATRAALRAVGVEPHVVVESDDHWMAFDVMDKLNVATVLPDLALKAAPAHVNRLVHIDLGFDRHIRLVTRDVLRPHPGFALLEQVFRTLMAA